MAAPAIPVATPVDVTPPGTEVVYGIPITSPAVAKLSRKVLTLSFLQGLVAVGAAIVGFWVETSWTTSLIGAALIPLCGFVGVRRKDPKLLQSFSFFNLLCCIVYVVALISTFAISIPFVNCVCDEACRNSRWEDPPMDTVNRICGNKERILNAYYLSCGVGGAAFILQALGYVYGKKLSQDPYFAVQAIERPMQQGQGQDGAVIANAPVVYAVGGPVPIQPGYGYYAAAAPQHGAIGRQPTMVVVSPRPGMDGSSNSGGSSPYWGQPGVASPHHQQQQFAFMNAPGIVAHPQALGVGVPLYPPPQQIQQLQQQQQQQQGASMQRQSSMRRQASQSQSQSQSQQQQANEASPHPFAYPSPLPSASGAGSTTIVLGQPVGSLPPPPSSQGGASSSANSYPPTATKSSSSSSAASVASPRRRDGSGGGGSGTA